MAIGGTTRTGSSTERALALCLREIVAQGAETLLISGRDLELPSYTPGAPLPAAARGFVNEIRRVHGLILGTPGYHGGISGLVKNAVDYFEEPKDDKRPVLRTVLFIRRFYQEKTGKDCRVSDNLGLRGELAIDLCRRLVRLFSLTIGLMPEGEFWPFRGHGPFGVAYGCLEGS